MKISFSFVCLFLVCLVLILNESNIEGFEHTYKNSWALSNQLTYIKNIYNDNRRKMKSRIDSSLFKPVNKKINYYINKYF